MTKNSISINGQEVMVEEGLTLDKLIAQYQLDIKKIAIEKDLEIISPDEFSKTILNNGCKIEIVHFIGGG